VLIGETKNQYIENVLIKNINFYSLNFLKNDSIPKFKVSQGYIENLPAPTEFQGIQLE